MKHCRVCDSVLTTENTYMVRVQNNDYICRSCYNKANAASRSIRRRKVIEGYGGKCVYCGSTSQLQLDHVYGNGAEHRKTVDHKTLYSQVIRLGFPKEYQLLCAKHNMAKQNMTDAQFKAFVHLTHIHLSTQKCPQTHCAPLRATIGKETTYHTKSIF